MKRIKLKDNEMTVKRLQKLFDTYYYNRYDILAPNIYLDWEFNEMDLMGLRKQSGFVDEIEIKFSVTDFKADFNKIVNIKNGPIYNKKNKHECIKKGMLHCNRFSFLIPSDIIDDCKIPEYSGLYVFYKNSKRNYRIDEIKKAPLLHKNKISDKLKYEVGRKMGYRYWNTQRIALLY